MDKACGWLTLFIPAAVDILSAVAWPLAVVIVVWWFRDQIRGLLKDRRLKKAGKEGVEFEDVEQPLQAPKEVSLSPDIPAKPGLADAPDVQAIEARLRGELTMVDGNQKIPLLVRRLAETTLGASFEWINNQIFGSQIACLRMLILRGPLPRKEIESNFNEFKVGNAEFFDKLGFDNWLGFLQRNGLVVDRSGDIEVTPMGRSFIQYRDATHGNEFKPF